LRHLITVTHMCSWCHFELKNIDYIDYGEDGPPYTSNS
jgi:hypothetical protein